MRPTWKVVTTGDVRAQWAGMYVTLNPRGEIRMNRAAFDRLGQPQAVRVLFDSVNNLIGLLPAAVGSKNAFHVGPLGRHGGRIVRAFKLLAEAGIVLPETVRFFDAEIDPEGVLVLDLRTASVPNRVKARLRREVSTKQ